MGIQAVRCRKRFSLEEGAGFMDHGSAAREAGSRRIAQGCNHRRSDQGLESNFACPSTTKRRLDRDPAPRSTNSGHADGLTTIHTHLATDIGRRSWTSELSPHQALLCKLQSPYQPLGTSQQEHPFEPREPDREPKLDQTPCSSGCIQSLLGPRRHLRAVPQLSNHAPCDSEKRCEPVFTSKACCTTSHLRVEGNNHGDV